MRNRPPKRVRRNKANSPGGMLGTGVPNKANLRGSLKFEVGSLNTGLRKSGGDAQPTKSRRKAELQTARAKQSQFSRQRA